MEEDRIGIDFSNGKAGYPRRNKRFTGITRNGFPFIGILTYFNNDIEFTEIGEFNESTHLIG